MGETPTVFQPIVERVGKSEELFHPFHNAIISTKALRVLSKMGLPPPT